ncbi:MAG: stage III sporulation protein AD [Lachnospiraceae bacterium]|nr:stage III sporulation protein AD [Lachnospiraceae bacterium]
MSVVKVAFLAVSIVVMASIFKQYKPEFGLYLVITASLFLFSLILRDITGLAAVYEQFEESMGEYREFLGILMKVISITYLCELCAGICKDAGYQTLAEQVELCAKVSIFLMGVPILMLLIGEIRGFLV